MTAQPLPGLVRADGTVVVPASVAGEVLRLLVFALTERARQTGGQPSPATRMLLSGLYSAAERHRQDGTPGRGRDGNSCGPEGTGVSVSEAAAAMGCSTAWVRYLLGRGRLAGHRSGGVWIVHSTQILTESQAQQQSA